MFAYTATSKSFAHVQPKYCFWHYYTYLHTVGQRWLTCKTNNDVRWWWTITSHREYVIHIVLSTFGNLVNMDPSLPKVLGGRPQQFFGQYTCQVPPKILYFIVKVVFKGSQYPEDVWFSFENKSTGGLSRYNQDGIDVSKRILLRYDLLPFSSTNVWCQVITGSRVLYDYGNDKLSLCGALRRVELN